MSRFEQAAASIGNLMEQVAPWRTSYQEMEDTYQALTAAKGCAENPVPENLTKAQDCLKDVLRIAEPYSYMPQIKQLISTVNAVRDLLEGKDVNVVELAKGDSGSGEMAEFMGLIDQVGQTFGFPDQAIEIVRDGAGRSSGFRFHLRNSWYVAGPLSSIVAVEITTNQKKTDPADVYYVLRGQRIHSADARTVHEIWWRFGEVMTVHVARPLFWFAGKQPNEYELECNLSQKTTMSYGLPDNTFTMHMKKTLVA